MTDDGTDGRPAGQDGEGTAEGALPDLTGIDLDALRSLDSPALSAVLDVLVRRTVEPTSVLCAFSNAS
ncbi:FXSXX-COOH protein [Streptomyces varsoviensis]|uniref:FXSXX-COOH protein n=1 Tax=Streptomyces varsoviensis TaxID=67373 RepID=UPI0033D2CCA0